LKSTDTLFVNTSATASFKGLGHSAQQRFERGLQALVDGDLWPAQPALNQERRPTLAWQP
jgi:hypothetical protein